MADIDEQGESTAPKEFSAEQIQVFLGQLRFLAARCDGAVEIDGAGFNKFDRFGKALDSPPKNRRKPRAFLPEISRAIGGGIRSELNPD